MTIKRTIFKNNNEAEMWKHRNDYSRLDDDGRWINTEFPPESHTHYPNTNGYRNANMEMLYYWFGVQYYDVRIEYKDNIFFGMVDDNNGACITDSEYNPISEIYPTANDLIKYFKFPDGRGLPAIIQDEIDILIDIL